MRNHEGGGSRMTWREGKFREVENEGEGWRKPGRGFVGR